MKPVLLSKNYVAVKFGIKKIGERSVECKGRRHNWDGKVTFYAQGYCDNVPDEVKLNPAYNFKNDSDSMTDYFELDSLRISQEQAPEVFSGLLELCQ